jgi:hypothetical protein
MKDISKLKDYRKKYKRYYGIEFGSDYAIHHLDFDRTNNSIENLLLLPSELHTRYHYYLQALNMRDWKSGELIIKTRIDEHGWEYYSDETLLSFLQTMKECEMWLGRKRQMDWLLQNKKENGV